MMNLFSLSTKPSPAIPNWFVFSFLVLSFFGFLDALYLTVRHYLGAPLVCSVFEGCEKVTTSQYATIFGLPIALLGALYYLVIFLLSVAYFDTRRSQLIVYAARLTIVGFLVSLWLVYLQFFVIGAICFYCILSAVTSTALFFLGLIMIRLKRI